MSDYVARSPDTNQTGHRRAIIPANAAEIRDEGGALLEFDVFCCNETRTEIMNRYRNVCHQATRQYEKCGSRHFGCSGATREVGKPDGNDRSPGGHACPDSSWNAGRE